MLSSFKTKSASSVSSFQQALGDEASSGAQVCEEQHAAPVPDGTNPHPKLTLSFSALKTMKSNVDDEVELGNTYTFFSIRLIVFNERRTYSD